ncbi:MAG: glycerate kinase [bacterium]|nr:glycerate kinase [bacterium]
MKIVLAPNSFKESLSAPDAAAAMERGALRARPDARTVCVPVADGGDGTAEAIVAARDGEWVELRVQDALHRPVTAKYGLIDGGDTAVIEMARASGLWRLRTDERDPMRTSTIGTGEMMRDALDRGAKTLILGIGGSATVDGGLGMAAALGYRLLDEREGEIEPNGAGLARLRRIDSGGVHPRLRQVRVMVACDVENPLVGPQGAAAVFGPQKGATPAMVNELDAGLRNAAACWREAFGADLLNTPGGGAAGGLGAGLIAFCGAEIHGGFDLVADVAGLDEALRGADLVLTGEGRLDEQTQYGKAPAGVAKRAKRLGVAAVGLGGSVSGEMSALYELGMTAMFSIAPGPIDLNDAMTRAAELLEHTSEQVVRLWRS